MVVEDEITTALELEELLVSHGYSLTGTASAGKEAVSMAKRLKPDLILMDIKLSGNMDGIDAAKAIKAIAGLPLIFLTGHSDEDLLARAKEADPLGYILKPLNERQIISAIEIALHSAEVMVQSHSSDYKVEANDHSASFVSKLSQQYPALTHRELDMARLIIQGLSNKEMAMFLNLAEGTIEWHRKNIRKKIGLNNKKQACFPSSFPCRNRLSHLSFKWVSKIPIQP